MQQLSLRSTFLFNELSIKSSFTDLDKISQEALTIEADSSTTILSLRKAFYLKTSLPLDLTINKGEGVSLITVKDSCLLTDELDSIVLTNPSTDTDAEVFLVYS